MERPDRTDGFRFTDIASREDLSRATTVREAYLSTELAYRRGYQHGYVTALRDARALFRAGRRVEEVLRVLDEFGNLTVSDWRHGRLDSGIRPPEYRDLVNGKVDPRQRGSWR